MRPWLHTYRGRCLEIRFGALNYQAGLTLPHLSFAFWRNSDYKMLIGWRWGRWVA